MDGGCADIRAMDTRACARLASRALLAAAVVSAGLPAAARADVTAQVPAVVARVPPPEFVAAATAGVSPTLGLISSSSSPSPLTGLIVGDKGRVVLSARAPGVFAGHADIFNAPGTYYWQAVDEQCRSLGGTGCASAPVAFAVTPLPAPAMVAPADGAQIVDGGLLTITVDDVPVYNGGRQLSVEYSRSPQLTSNGLFAQSFTGLPRPTWSLASDVGADGTATRTLPLPYVAALTHARIYWHAVRNDCFAEPDCIVTDGVRSFTIAPGVGGESRVVFGLTPRPIPIGYVLSAGRPRRKIKVGDVLVVITCRALPCHVNMRVTVSFGGRARLRAIRTFSRPADPAKWWEQATHSERVRTSKRLRAQITAALKRHRRVSVTAMATATDLAGRPERHVSRSEYFISPPPKKT
jgi:hypothetical protein